MRITPHLLSSFALVVLAALVVVPVLLTVGVDRPVATTQLTVPQNQARPTLATADRAIGPISQAHAGQPRGNPFMQPTKGVAQGLPIPEPPPPALVLPEPPVTPFAPAR